jgi:hypothetical protein
MHIPVVRVPVNTNGVCLPLHSSVQAILCLSHRIGGDRLGMPPSGASQATSRGSVRWQRDVHWRLRRAFNHDNVARVRWIHSIVSSRIARIFTLAEHRDRQLHSAAPREQLSRPMKNGSGYFTIATVRSVPLLVHWSLPVVGLLALIAGEIRPVHWGSYFVSFVLLVVIHESGHLFAAVLFGLKIYSVRISVIGGLCLLERPRNVGQSVVVYSAGFLAQAAAFLLSSGALAFHMIRLAGPLYSRSLSSTSASLSQI